MLAMAEGQRRGDDDGTRGQHAKESTLAILFFTFVVIYLLSPKCWLWQRDNDEEDAGDDNGTRGQQCRRKYVGYTTCLLFFV